MPNIVQTIELVYSFSDLPNGWNFGSGGPTASVPLDQSVVILYAALALGLKEAEAFPGTDGEVQLNIYKGDYTLEMIFQLDGTISTTFEEGEKSIRLAKDASLNRAIKILKDFEYNKCRSYVSLISPSTTVQRKSGSQVWPSNPQVTVAVYPSLTRIVPKTKAAIYVHTLPSTMPAQQGRLSCFGKSLTNKSPKRAGRQSTV